MDATPEAYAARGSGKRAGTINESSTRLRRNLALVANERIRVTLA